MRNLLHHSMKLMASYIFHLPRKGICTMISIYQQTLSPDHGPLKHLYPYGYCRHEPTCSDYGKQNIMKRGVIIGGILLAVRLLTCHPWKKPSDKKILKALHRHHWNQYPVSTFFPNPNPNPQSYLRASYSGYYPSLPSWWRRFDSARPLQILTQNKLVLVTPLALSKSKGSARPLQINY